MTNDRLPLVYLWHVVYIPSMTTTDTLPKGFSPILVVWGRDYRLHQNCIELRDSMSPSWWRTSAFGVLAAAVLCGERTMPENNPDTPHVMALVEAFRPYYEVGT